MRLARATVRKARIEIIPMIDTIFFLLVFFMLASLAMSDLATVPVSLPAAHGAPPADAAPVVLTGDRAGRTYFNQQQVPTVREAVRRLALAAEPGRTLSVVINIDQHVEYRRFVELFDAVRASGLPRISLAVKPSGE